MAAHAHPPTYTHIAPITQDVLGGSRDPLFPDDIIPAGVALGPKGSQADYFSLQQRSRDDLPLAAAQGNVVPIAVTFQVKPDPLCVFPPVILESGSPPPPSHGLGVSNACPLPALPYTHTHTHTHTHTQRH